MILRYVSSALTLCLAIACSLSVSWAQVDPFWLRSWNKAQETRPTHMASRSRIAPPTEPGPPLIIHGQVFKPDGRTPASGVVVHAYHRDRDGFDFGARDRALTTWRLQGWARTDAQGRFEFSTIRPAADHMGREGAHIHFTLEAAQFGRQWAPTVFLADDPILSQRTRQESARAGSFGSVRDVRTLDGVQHIDVRLKLKAHGNF